MKCHRLLSSLLVLSFISCTSGAPANEKDISPTDARSLRESRSLIRLLQTDLGDQFLSPSLGTLITKHKGIRFREKQDWKSLSEIVSDFANRHPINHCFYLRREDVLGTLG